MLVFRPGCGIWLSICGIDSMQRQEEYRALEWGPDGIDDLRGSHFFPSRWELLTWLETQFSTGQMRKAARRRLSVRCLVVLILQIVVNKFRLCHCNFFDSSSAVGFVGSLA